MNSTNRASTANQDSLLETDLGYESSSQPVAAATPPRKDRPPTGDVLSWLAQLEQRQDNCDQRIANLVAENDRLRQENSRLREATGPSKVRDAGFSRLLREHLQDLARRDGKSDAWDFTKPFRHPDNRRVLKALQDYIQSLLTDAQNTAWNEATIREKAHNNFRAGLARHKRQTTGSQAAFNQQRAAEKRRSAKLKARTLVFQHNPSLLDRYPGGEALLLKELMSDDEDVKDEHGYLKCLRILRPNWRSQQANEFLDLLSDTSMQARNEAGFRARVILANRVYSTVAVRVREGLLANLPPWAKAAGPNAGQ